GNRYVNVPGVSRDTRRIGTLRKAVVAEILIAAGVLGATGLLSELAPAASAAGRGSPVQTVRQTRLVANGHDFATTTRVRLVVTPGTVGPNRFVANVDDFDTGRPVPATSVTLNFTLPGHPELGEPTLRLHRMGSEWMGDGTVLSIFGRWDVNVLVQESSGGVEVPLQVETRLPPEQCSVTPGSGDQPTLYTIALAKGNTLDR